VIVAVSIHFTVVVYATKGELPSQNFTTLAIGFDVYNCNLIEVVASIHVMQYVQCIVYVCFIVLSDG